jgi:hypothetical protein
MFIIWSVKSLLPAQQKKPLKIIEETCAYELSIFREGNGWSVYVTISHSSISYVAVDP